MCAAESATRPDAMVIPHLQLREREPMMCSCELQESKWLLACAEGMVGVE